MQPHRIDKSELESRLRKSANRAIVSLVCCGRYTALTDRLYHQIEGTPPFHVTSPLLPPGWRSVELDGRFDLGWATEPRL